MAEAFRELPITAHSSAMMWAFLYIPPKGRFTYSKPKALDPEGEGLLVQLFAPTLHPVHCHLPHHLPLPAHQLWWGLTHTDFVAKQPSRFASDSPFACFLDLP